MKATLHSKCLIKGSLEFTQGFLDGTEMLWSRDVDLDDFDVEKWEGVVKNARDMLSSCNRTNFLLEIHLIVLQVKSSVWLYRKELSIVEGYRAAIVFFECMGRIFWVKLADSFKDVIQCSIILLQPHVIFLIVSCISSFGSKRLLKNATHQLFSSFLRLLSLYYCHGCRFGAQNLPLY